MNFNDIFGKNVTDDNTVKYYLWVADTYGSLKICPLLRVVHYWEVI